MAVAGDRTDHRAEQPLPAYAGSGDADRGRVLVPPASAVAALRACTIGLEGGAEVIDLAVLTVHLHRGAVGAAADVACCFPAGPSCRRGAPGRTWSDRGVGDGVEGGADAAALTSRSGRPSRSTVDWPLQGGDQVGQRVVGGAQVDRAVAGARRAAAWSPWPSRRSSPPGRRRRRTATRVQIVLMWAWSRNSECGRATETRPMLASPWRG